MRTKAHSSRARQQQHLQNKQQQQQVVPPSSGSVGNGQALQVQDADGPDAANESCSSSSSPPQPGRPQRVLGQGSSSNSSLAAVQLQHSSCGWVFAESDVFDPEALLALLQATSPVAARIKCVCRVGQKKWVMPAAVQSEPGAGAAAGADEASDLQQSAGATPPADNSSLQLQEVCYRGPSMVEVILDQQHNHQQAGAIAAALAAAGCFPSRSTVEAVSESVEQLSLAAGSPLHGSGNDSAGSLSGKTSSTDNLWVLLEQALLNCLKSDGTAA